jgi:vacuolar-type H+-ATPase subunit I/STV1
MVSFDEVREIIRFVRDLLVVVGVPGAAAVAAWLYSQRMKAKQDAISSLEHQLDEARALRYSEALKELKAQEELHKRSVKRLERQVDSLAEESTSKDAIIVELRDVKQAAEHQLKRVAWKRRRITTYLASEHASVLKTLAERSSVPMGRLVDQALEEYFRSVGVSLPDPGEKVDIDKIRRALEESASSPEQED